VFAVIPGQAGQFGGLSHGICARSLTLLSVTAPNSRTSAGKRPAVVGVWLYRCVDDEDPKSVTWAGEWDLLYQGVGEEDTNYDDLDDLIDDVLEFAERFGKDFDISIEWTIGGDPPPNGTVEDVINALGIILPGRPGPAAEDKR
jgi:hypothetical protein